MFVTRKVKNCCFELQKRCGEINSKEDPIEIPVEVC